MMQPDTGWPPGDFPGLAYMKHAPRLQRDHRPGELNLKSCELLHPGVLSWQAANIARLEPRDFVQYPLSGSALAGIAEAYRRSPQSVLLTPGTDYAIQLLTEAIGVPAGRVVIANPHFDGWDRAALRFQVPLDEVTAREGKPVAVQSLVERMRSGPPGLVVVTQPDSITGHLYPAGEMAALSAAAAHHGSVVVIDTCYLAFSDDGEESLAGIDRHPHALRINSFSKCFGLAGARVGAVLAAESVIDYLSGWNSASLVSGPAQRLLIEALRDPAFFTGIYREIRSARGHLTEAVPQVRSKWQARTSHANFVAFDVPLGEGVSAAGQLREAGIRIKCLTGVAGFRDGVRIATPSAESVDRVLSALDRHQRAELTPSERQS